MAQGHVIDAADFGQLEGPLALCSSSGHVRVATPQARALLSRVAGDADPLHALPDDMWWALRRVAPGHTVEWRPKRNGQTVLGCTRYQMHGEFLVVLTELSERYAALSQRMHRKRLESTGQLVASLAHELRNSIATIVYSADLLSVAGSDLEPTSVQQTANDMVAASRQIQFTLAGLLDYAQLGPTVVVPVSVRQLLSRTTRFIKTLHPDATLRFVIEIAPDARWVRGNFLRIEQILVNLLLNAIEAAGQSATVEIHAELDDRDGEQVRLRISDDGPGVPPELAASIFEPFFTTREDGSGLGLSSSREAAVALEGALELESTGPGACFALYLPRGDRL